MAKSTTPAKRRKAASKPEKPRPDYPLFAHASGKWAKTIKGRTVYFGSWDDPDAAEQEYLDVAEDLHAGRPPQKHKKSGPTVADAVNLFLSAKRTRMEAGSLSPRTFVGYDATCKLLVETFGRNRAVDSLGPADFQKIYAKISKKSLATVGRHVTHARMVFRFAEENDLIGKRVKFGSVFKAPKKDEKRKAKAKQKNQNGSRTFEREQIVTVIEAASRPLRAMILLGINGGLGNTDIAQLNLPAIDWEHGGWLDYPRPKTGIDRRIPMWPETRLALLEAVSYRPTPASEDDLAAVFVTKYGQRWVRYEIVEETHFGKLRIKPKQDDAVAKETSKLLKKLGLKRPGLSFYSLRHTFETVAGGCKDQVAVDAMMGHVDASMAAEYRDGIEDARLRACVNHVRAWLLPDATDEAYNFDASMPNCS